MKHQQQGESTFSRLAGLVTRNFGLKSLSLALAIVIYVVLQAEIAPTVKTDGSVAPQQVVYTPTQPDETPATEPEPTSEKDEPKAQTPSGKKPAVPGKSSRNGKH